MVGAGSAGIWRKGLRVRVKRGRTVGQPVGSDRCEPNDNRVLSHDLHPHFEMLAGEVYQCALMLRLLRQGDEHHAEGACMIW